MKTTQPTSNHAANSTCQQGYLPLEGMCMNHAVILNCVNQEKKCPGEMKDLGPGSNQYKNKPMQLVDLETVALHKQEDDLKLLLYKELHQRIQAEKLHMPSALATRIKLPHKQIHAIYQGNLKALDLFQLLAANMQFGYNIIVCIRANIDYLPGNIVVDP